MPLPCSALQARFQHRPFGAVHHDRDTRDDVRLGPASRFRNVVMACFAVEHPFVHVDVNDLRAVVHLLPGDGQRGLVIALQDQLLELRRAGDIGALADIDEVGFGPDRERLQSRSAACSGATVGATRGWQSLHGLGDGADMGRGRAAAAADDVQPAVLAPIREAAGPAICGVSGKPVSESGSGRPAFG